MTRMLVYLILGGILALVSYQSFKLYLQRQSLKKDLTQMNSQLNTYKEENEAFIADIEYFKKPSNLVKELKSRFNYVNPGEKLLIVVPKSPPND